MENTEKSAAQWQELVSEKDKEIVELRKQVDWFKGQFKLLQAKQFGPSSEKSMELGEQLFLFNETELLADPKAVEPDLEQIVYKRRKQSGKRDLDFSKLPTEQVVHELPEEEQVCPVCGRRCMLAGMMWFGGNFGMSRRSIKWWNTSRQPIAAGIVKRTPQKSP